MDVSGPATLATLLGVVVAMLTVVGGLLVWGLRRIDVRFEKVDARLEKLDEKLAEVKISVARREGPRRDCSSAAGRRQPGHLQRRPGTFAPARATAGMRERAPPPRRPHHAETTRR